MPKVKKVSELTHRQKQARRSGKYSKLMGVEIPQHDSDRKLVKGLWYVIWEEKFLKPTILKYSFRGQIFAQKYCDKFISDKRYNILKGSTLIELGFNRAIRSLRSVADIREAGVKKYKFPDGLPAQRKKTLRTMYRRNYRRLLFKALEYRNGSKNIKGD